MLALAAALSLTLPLHFEQNQGQHDSQIKFVGVAPDYRLELSDTAIRLRTPTGDIELKFPATKPEGFESLAAKSNYYSGKDSHTDIANFARVRYPSVFRGVDLEIYGSGGKVEYDWVVSPGADPHAIRFSVTGAPVSMDANGDLVAGPFRQTHPRAFQGTNEIPDRFLLHGNEVSFAIDRYDRTRKLVIDPVLLVNTSFGGSGALVNFPGVHGISQDTGTGIGVDASGNIYISGTTYSTDFPQVNGLGESCASPCLAYGQFVTKLSPDGKTILYSTYLQVSNGGFTYKLVPLLPGGMAVDAGGNVYLTGAVSGVGLPGVTKTAGGSDAFLTRLDTNGKWIGTMLFGGSGDDAGTSISLGPDGYIYLAGTTASSDFPVTAGSYQAPAEANNVFVAKLSFQSIFGPTSGQVIYAARLGAAQIAFVAADANGNATVAAGVATAPGCPILPGYGFVDKLSSGGDSLLYSGSLSLGPASGVALDAGGNAYIATTLSNCADMGKVVVYTQIAVEKWSASGARLPGIIWPGIYTTAGAVAVDASGTVYIGGAITRNANTLPVSQPVQATEYNQLCFTYTPSGSTPSGEFPCGSAGVLATVNSDLKTTGWSTYLGSGNIAALVTDTSGNVYATGMNSAPGQAKSIGVVKIGPGNLALDIPNGAIANSASFAKGLPSPGGLASIVVNATPPLTTMRAPPGTLPTQMEGFSLTVDGTPAPILAIAALANGAQQINFQVPFEAKSNAMQISYRGSTVFAFPAWVGPGIFTAGGTMGAIQHANDYSLVTEANPAHPGETIIIYATGLGPVSPAVATGAAATGAASVNNMCGSLQVLQFNTPNLLGTISYAGLTPGFAGLYQINLQLNANLATGDLPVVIQGQPSPGNCFPIAVVDSNLITLPVR